MENWFKNLALRTVLSSALRHGLTLLGGVLVTNGWVEEASWTDLVVQVSPAILAQFLSLLEKAAAKKKLAVALDMPAGKTEADLNKVMKKVA